MKLRQLVKNLRLDLGDADPDIQVWTNDELERSAEAAVNDLDRVLPRLRAYEVTIAATVTGESWTSGDPLATWVSLAYGNIKPKSETVTNEAGTITYKRDTDYTMDYLGGKIQPITGGALVKSTAYKISYSRSRLAVDISSLTDLIRVVSVEYPTGRVPQTFVGFRVSGSWLYVQTTESGTAQSQSDMTVGEHLVVYYEAINTPATKSEEGSYPRSLDGVVIKGAAAYAMFNRSSKMVNQASSDLASARTHVADIGPIITAVESALGKVATHVGEADTALDKVSANAGYADLALVQVPENLTAAKTALGKVAGQVGKADTELITMATESGLAKVALDRVPGVGSETQTALSGAATAVTDASSALSDLAGRITLIDNNLNLLLAVWAAEEKPRIDAAIYSLTAGAALINKVNVGADPADESRQYAEAYLAAAELARDRAAAYQESLARVVDQCSVLIGRATQHVARANAKVAEASQRAALAEVYIGEASQRSQIAGNYVSAAGQHLTSGQIYNTEADARVAVANGYIAQAAQWLAICDRYTAEADRRLGMAQTYIQEAAQRLNEVQWKLSSSQQYVLLATQVAELSVRYREEAVQRHTEYWNILGTRAQLIRERVSVPVNQPRSG